MNPQSSRVPGCPASCQRAWRRIYKSARYQNELRTHPPIPRPLKQPPFHLTQARASLYMLAEVVETRGRPAAIEMRGRRAGCGLEVSNVIEHSTKKAGGVYIMRPQPADPSRSALPSPAAPSSPSSSSSFPRLAFLPGLHLLALSMINILLVLALTSSSFVAPSRCTPVDWLRKLASPPTPGSARDDGSWLWGWAWASDGSVSVVDRTPPVTFPARPASFGAELADPLLGYVIPLSSFTAPCPARGDNKTTPGYSFEADPVLGCPELCIGGDRKPEDADTWIALVQRGGCPFVEKARQAQKLGAKAVVVGGDRDNPDALLNMFSESESATHLHPFCCITVLRRLQKMHRM